MAIFSFSRDGKDEPESPPSKREDTQEEVPVAGYTSEERVVDEAQDDLHREMKPRQLSEPPAFALPNVTGR